VELALTPTTPEDLPFVMAAERAEHARAFVIAWSPEQHMEAIADRDQEHLIVHADGERAGFVLEAGLTSPHDSVELRRIVVSRPGHGIGRRAIEAVLDRAFESQGAHRVWLDVKPHNARARRLYAATGFVEEGVLRDAIRTPAGYESLVVMSILRSEWQARRR
jgi:diamine N-acetyltransferase